MSKALNSRVDIKDWAKSMFKRFEGLLAGSLTDEEKLDRIVEGLQEDVAENRKSTRKIAAQIKQLVNEDTDELETLEALRDRETKLVELGARQHKAGDTEGTAKTAAALKALREGLLATQEQTFETLQDAYKTSLANLTTAQEALETVQANAPAMLAAIEAHRTALAMADEARSGEVTDLSFMDDLADELAGVRAERAADEQIDADLAAQEPSIDDLLAEMEDEDADADILAEFAAAAGE